MFTLHSVALFWGIKTKQPRKLGQEVSETSRWMYLAYRAVARESLSKSDHVRLSSKVKSTSSPTKFYLIPTLLTSSPNLLPLSLFSIHRGFLAFPQTLQGCTCPGQGLWWWPHTAVRITLSHPPGLCSRGTSEVPPLLTSPVSTPPSTTHHPP